MGQRGVLVFQKMMKTCARSLTPTLGILLVLLISAFPAPMGSHSPSGAPVRAAEAVVPAPQGLPFAPHERTVPGGAAVQVWFVIETTLYDGAYDPTAGDAGISSCAGPCNESDAVAYFVHNAGRVATTIGALHPSLSLTFGLIDYFSTSNGLGTCAGSSFAGDHDDGDGCSLHVDVATPVAAASYQSSVTSTFQATQLGGSYYMPDTDYSDNILTSSSTASLYGLQTGVVPAWSTAPYHVVGWVGSTAPRDAQYPENYAVSQSDYRSGWGSTCEPVLFPGEPSCEAWLTTHGSVGQIAQRNGTLLNMIDVADGVTNGSSPDYTGTVGPVNDSRNILRSGCEMAVATGGIWAGPSGYRCSASLEASGLGNLTCQIGTSCYQSGNYTTPPMGWYNNLPLGYALTHLRFPNTTGAPNPLDAILVATPSRLQLGSPLVLQTVANAGFPPYTYSYGDLPQGCTSANVSSITCSPAVHGNFTLVVNVTDTQGEHANATTFLSISTSPPLTLSAQGGPLLGHVPMTVLFNSTVSGGYAPYTWLWSFGDGSTGIGQNVAHTYTLAGNFSVQVTLTDSSGTQLASGMAVEVLPSPPPLTASMTAAPTSGPIYLHVNFTATGSGGAGPYTYFWAFGDGSSSPLQNPYHIYTLAGTYYATVTVNDSVGASYVAGTYVTATPPPLVVRASATPNGATAPVTVLFNSTVSGGLAPYTFSWTFGDGGTSLVRNPTHRYVAGSNYSVYLTVQDAVGTYGYASFYELVLAPPPLSVYASALPLSGTAPVVITFSSSVTGGAFPYTYLWTFGDTSTSSLATPTHIYTSAGTYLAGLTVADAAGSIASATSLTITVAAGGTALRVAAAAAPVSGLAPLRANFTGAAGGGGGNYTWSWSFGDGSNLSSLQDPWHLYQAPGTYQARLTVTASGGATATASAWVNVSGGGAPLSVTAAATPSVISLGASTTFLATIVGGVAPYSFGWTNVPAGCSAGDIAMFSCTPTGAGTYTVSVSVTDGAGHTATQTAALVVEGGTPPPSNTGGAPTTGGPPMWELGLLIAVLVVAALAALGLARRRRRRSRLGTVSMAPPPPPPAPMAVYTPPPPASTPPPPPTASPGASGNGPTGADAAPSAPTEEGGGGSTGET